MDFMGDAVPGSDQHQHRGGGGGGGSGKKGGGKGKGGGGKGSGAGISRTQASAPFLAKIRQQMANQEHALEDKQNKKKALKAEMGINAGNGEEDDDIREHLFEDDFHEAVVVSESGGQLDDFEQKMADQLKANRQKAEQERKDRLAELDKPITFKLSVEKEEKRKKLEKEREEAEAAARKKAVEEEQEKQKTHPEFYWRLNELEKRIFDACLEQDKRDSREAQNKGKGERLAPICFHFNTKRGCNKMNEKCDRRHIKITLPKFTSSNSVSSGADGTSLKRPGNSADVPPAKKKPTVTLSYEDDDEDESD
ncbi:unnamed protein product [Amoebophrya sp. A25]|nr:unnamed protein product [Amoebophrya sp. A25]|eukprot:GSA25T00007898001.1